MEGTAQVEVRHGQVLQLWRPWPLLEGVPQAKEGGGVARQRRRSCRAGCTAVSWFRGSLLGINHVMSVHGVCQVELSMARMFELAFVSLV